jgi:citrate lyase alpha subunit
MAYISYANTYAAMVRNCLKDPHKTKALSREQVYYKLQTYQVGDPQKLGTESLSLSCPRSVRFFILVTLVV